MRFENLMAEKYDFGQKQVYELILYSSLAFLFPLMFGHLAGLPNQLIVGTVVNGLLFASAVYVSGWKNLFPVIVPSIGAYLTGFVFGVDTHFLLYLIPAIWLGNLAYVLGIKKFFVSDKRTFFTIFASSAIKAAVIFVPAFALVSFNVVPSAFLVAMGPLQFITAVSGALLGVVFVRLRNISA